MSAEDKIMNGELVTGKKDRIEARHDEKKEGKLKSIDYSDKFEMPEMSKAQIQRYRAKRAVESMGKNGEDDYTVDSRPTSVLSQEVFQLIFQEMFEQKKEFITKLDLRDMEVSDKTVDEICKLKWLKCLFLPYNKLTDASMVKIGQELINLEELCLSGNEGIQSIEPCKSLPNLKLLWVNGTSVDLTAKEIQWIANSQLENVNLSDTYTGVKEITMLCNLWQQDVPVLGYSNPIIRPPNIKKGKKVSEIENTEFLKKQNEEEKKKFSA